jgi:hypothetical protein
VLDCEVSEELCYVTKNAGLFATAGGHS